MTAAALLDTVSRSQWQISLGIGWVNGRVRITISAWKERVQHSLVAGVSNLKFLLSHKIKRVGIHNTNQQSRNSHERMFKAEAQGTSLEVQWLRLHAPSA